MSAILQKQTTYQRLAGDTPHGEPSTHTYLYGFSEEEYTQGIAGTLEGRGENEIMKADLSFLLCWKTS